MACRPLAGSGVEGGVVLRDLHAGTGRRGTAEVPHGGAGLRLLGHLVAAAAPANPFFSASGWPGRLIARLTARPGTPRRGSPGPARARATREQRRWRRQG